MASSFDLVIKGGLVVDGTGNPWLRKDIGITNGKITGLGHITEDSGEIMNATPVSLTCTIIPTLLSWRIQMLKANKVGGHSSVVSSLKGTIHLKGGYYVAN